MPKETNKAFYNFAKKAVKDEDIVFDKVSQVNELFTTYLLRKENGLKWAKHAGNIKYTEKEEKKESTEDPVTKIEVDQSKTANYKGFIKEIPGKDIKYKDANNAFVEVPTDGIDLPTAKTSHEVTIQVDGKEEKLTFNYTDRESMKIEKPGSSYLLSDTSLAKDKEYEYKFDG